MSDDHRVPLTTLLSQAFVAFTIELDNEFERQMPHRTTTGGARQHARGPWLVSLAMWANCMRYVADDGISQADLLRLARTPTNLHGMRRWGYVVIDTETGLIRPTRAGRAARAIWEPLPGAIEARWRARFGDEQVDGLRASLWRIASGPGSTLPDVLPILGHALWSRGRFEPGPARPDEQAGELPLYALLSRVLLSFAIEYERESELSLAIAADVLRVLDDEGALLRDVPHLGGVSKEAVAMALGVLEKRGLATVEPGPSGGRFKVVVLTDAGAAARVAHRELLADVEARAGDATAELRRALERLPLGELNLYDEGWRASRPMPASLPHYPMVLHRGGFPDGS